jgi:hypothetical protein
MVMGGHFGDDFDSIRNFERHTPLTRIKPKSFFKGFIGLWFVGVLCMLAFWGTVIYVAAHFIGKFW